MKILFHSDWSVDLFLVCFVGWIEDVTKGRKVQMSEFYVMNSHKVMCFCQKNKKNPKKT